MSSNSDRDDEAFMTDEHGIRRTVSRIRRDRRGLIIFMVIIFGLALWAFLAGHPFWASYLGIGGLGGIAGIANNNDFLKQIKRDAEYRLDDDRRLRRDAPRVSVQQPHGASADEGTI